MSATAGEPAARRALLLEIDPDLGESLDESRRREARSRIAVPVVDLGPGAWSPQDLVALGQQVFGLLVCDGLVVREFEIAGSRCSDLLGPGDLVAFDVDADLLLTPGDSWYVSERATVALLDDHLLPGLRAWPSVAARLIARGARQAARSADQRAISQLPRVELRLRALLWHLSSRWGRMGVEGPVLPLALTHEALGRLVGARRPTVTLALSALARSGQVVRRPDGAWLLRTASKPVGPSAPAARPIDAVLPSGEPEVRRRRGEVASRPAAPRATAPRRPSRPRRAEARAPGA